MKVSKTHLAHGLIFSARPRLTQNPAPPVANQKLTGFCEDAGKKKQLVHKQNNGIGLKKMILNKRGIFKRTILLSPSLSVASMGRSRLGLPTYMSWVWGYWERNLRRVRTFT